MIEIAVVEAYRQTDLITIFKMQSQHFTVFEPDFPESSIIQLSQLRLLIKVQDSYSPMFRRFCVKSILSKVFSSIYSCPIVSQVN
jgi:hypothetical protein